MEPLPAQATSVHGPYEDAIIAGCDVLGKLIDGQSPEQKHEIWGNLIAICKPLIDVAVRALTVTIVPAPEGGK